MQIFLDLDYVLFDTASYKRAVYDALEKAGISGEIYLETLGSSFDGPSADSKRLYIPQEHELRIKKKLPSFKQGSLLKIHKQLLSRKARFLYPEVPSFLESASKFELILVSYGNEQFQRQKIKSLGIRGYFSCVFITQDPTKVAPLVNIATERGLFFDDKPEVLDAVHRVFPSILPVKVVRSDPPVPVDFNSLPMVVNSLSSSFLPSILDYVDKVT